MTTGFQDFKGRVKIRHLHLRNAFFWTVQKYYNLNGISAQSVLLHDILGIWVPTPYNNEAWEPLQSDLKPMGLPNMENIRAFS